MARLFVRANPDKLSTAAQPTSATSSITMSCWVKVTTTLSSGSGQAAFFIGNGGTDGYGIFAQSGLSGTNWAVLLGGVAWKSGSSTPTAGTWTHLLFTMDGSNNIVLYFNGLVDSSGLTGTPVAPSALTSVGDDGTGTRSMGGAIADAAIWNRVLTNSEISALAAGLHPNNIRGSLTLSLPLSYYPLLGTSSPEPDVTGGRNLTVTGATQTSDPTYESAGANFGSRLFDGANSYSPIATGFTIAATAPTFTWSGWLYYTNTATTSSFFGPVDAGANGGVQFRYTTANPPVLALLRANQAVLATGSTNISANAWHNIVVTYNGSTTSSFIDGSIDVNAVAGNYNASSSLNYIIGGSYASGVPAQIWKGRIAEVAFWNGIVLSNSEISALAAGIRAKDIRPASLKVYLPFDGANWPDADLSGNAYNAALVLTTVATGPPLTYFTPRWPLSIDIAAAPPAFQLMGQAML